MIVGPEPTTRRNAIRLPSARVINSGGVRSFMRGHLPLLKQQLIILCDRRVILTDIDQRLPLFGSD